MSDYGVLVVESEGGSYQIVAEVASRAEALEMAANYLSAGPDQDCLAPDAFVINRRDGRGWFTVREPLADRDVIAAQDLVAEIARVEKSIRRVSYNDAAFPALSARLRDASKALEVLGGAR